MTDQSKVDQKADEIVTAIFGRCPIRSYGAHGDCLPCRTREAIADALRAERQATIEACVRIVEEWIPAHQEVWDFKELADSLRRQAEAM